MEIAGVTAPVPNELLDEALFNVFALKTPALMVTAPVNVFKAVNAMVPAPAFVTPAAPLITLLIVKSVAVVLSSATVNVRVAPRATGQDITAPLPLPLV